MSRPHLALMFKTWTTPALSPYHLFHSLTFARSTMMGPSLAPPLVRSRTLSSPSLVDEPIKQRKTPNAQSPFATISRAFKWPGGSLSRKGGPKGINKQIRTVASCNNLLDPVSRVGEVDGLSPIGECNFPESISGRHPSDTPDSECQQVRRWPQGNIYCFTRGSQIKKPHIQQPKSAKTRDKRSLLTKLATYLIPDWERPGEGHGVAYPRHAFGNESPYPLTYSCEALARHVLYRRASCTANSLPFQ